MKQTKFFRYFMNKSSIYDYAILIDGNEPYAWGKTILVIVENNANVIIDSTATEEGKRAICEFVKSWGRDEFPYKEVKSSVLVMCPSIKDKLDEIMASINETDK